MNARVILWSAISLCVIGVGGGHAKEPGKQDSIEAGPINSSQGPIGKPGLAATYRHESGGATRGSVVRTLLLSLGPVEESNGRQFQWLSLTATKANEESFRIWILTNGYPPASVTSARETTARYIVQEADTQALEFRHRLSGKAVLPSIGAWNHLFPRAVEGGSSNGPFAEKVRYLGHIYLLERLEDSRSASGPANVKILELLPDVLIGVPHNTRQKDETRRYDGSDYELIRLTQRDYDEMIQAGMNCLRVDKEQAGWIDRRDVFYWGIGPEEVSYPECLYRSNYLGHLLFLDEPAVCTRDQVVRPHLTKDREFRKTITPQIVLEEFQKYFGEAKYQGAPTALLRGLAARPDVDAGSMQFLQENLYTWETMVSTALYQLGEGESGPPSAMVFEPSGRFGTRRTLPEMNMAYGCQISVDDPKNLIDIIYGFLRGAARVTEKEWGTSIYGQVDCADASWFLTHAYDLGAQNFFFWDSSGLACVPYSECLALTRTLRAHVETHPYRDAHTLKQAAEVAILLPPGYNLGHVHMGKGNLWGLGELNLERVNRQGVKYRTVMGNFFTEIERCIRMGVAYDLFWDIEGHPPAGYREVVRVREDGKVEVIADGKNALQDGPRTLSYQAALASAQGLANSHFRASRLRLCQEQIGGIDATDEQDKPNRTKDADQCLFEEIVGIASEQRLQWYGVHAVTFLPMCRQRLDVPRDDRVQHGLNLSPRDARPQSSGNSPETRVLLKPRMREPEIAVLLGKPKMLRHHPNNGERLFVQADGLADDILSASTVRLPKPVA